MKLRNKNSQEEFTQSVGRVVIEQIAKKIIQK